MQTNQFNKNLYVLSAETIRHNPLLNAARTEALISMVKSHTAYDGASFAECEGRYEGNVERSFILNGVNKMLAHHIASVFDQECFIELQPYRHNGYKAYMVDVFTGDTAFIGYWRSVPESEVHENKLDYTRDGHGTYFSIFPTDNTDLITKMEKLGG